MTFENATDKRRLPPQPVELARWDDEGGAQPPRPAKSLLRRQTPDMNNAELVQLRVRVIALENVLIALLLKANEEQLDDVRTMAGKPNNSDVNERDRGNKTLTPEDQSQTKGDVELAARVRRAVVDHDGVSMDGKNIKIIAINNAVTLRGPVKDAAERTAIEKTARTAAGTSVTVDSQLEVR